MAIWRLLYFLHARSSLFIVDCRSSPSPLHPNCASSVFVNSICLAKRKSNAKLKTYAHIILVNRRQSVCFSSFLFVPIKYWFIIYFEWNDGMKYKLSVKYFYILHKLFFSFVRSFFSAIYFTSFGVVQWEGIFEPSALCVIHPRIGRFEIESNAH